ncbi:MAG: ABC transporter substrate-binding protein [Bacteroidetes bacterium]|nr:ABC transporter substrate-binding protein [Bacteroidota bacterium]
MKIHKSLLQVCCLLLALHLICCKTAQTGSAGPKPGNPNKVGKSNKYETMDTVRWTGTGSGRPPIQNAAAEGNTPDDAFNGDVYRIALLLPFLGNQAQGTQIPEKSKLALQFYTGAKIALEQYSKSGKGPHIQLDVYDTQASDAEFQQVLNDRQLAKAQVLIGPIRNSHVQLAAAWAKNNRKILISPETPTADIAQQQPDFIQINPSLRSHCEAISAFVQDHYPNSTVTLICRQKEADRLPYFQNYLKERTPGAAPFGELVVADDLANFDKTNFPNAFKPGKTAVFILPSWASQDFVMAFFRKIKSVKGANNVAVFGMPQWKNFESIDPEYLKALNVHISSADFIYYNQPEVQTFQQQFYDQTGALPNDDGFNGYDVTRWLCDQLKRSGLSFPDRLNGQKQAALHTMFNIKPVYNNGTPADETVNYLENKFVYILKFKTFGFEPADLD